MNELEFLQKDISSKTLSIAKEMLESVNIYINSFDKNEFLSFSNAANAEKYSSNYNTLLSSISEKIPNLIVENARLASLLLRADSAMNTDLIILCESRFNAFEAFELELNKYMSSMDNEFKTNKTSPVSLMNLAMQFKIAINKLIEANA